MSQEKNETCVGKLAEFQAEQPRCVTAFGRSLVVVRHRDHVYAMEDACPHRGGPLSQGHVENGALVCPLHGWNFDLGTGKLVGNENVRARCYAVEVTDAQDVILRELQP